MPLLHDVALSPRTPVLVEGPGGVEVARRLHELTYDGADAPLIEVDCTWLPTAEVGRLLFGEERDASIYRGFVERANGGTHFLDDVASVRHGAEKLVRSGRLRRDLHARLCVFPIVLQ
jgi:DNA-binding NtrC family response regulator